MELIAYLLVIALHCNIFGSAVLFLEFIRLEIMEVLSNVRGSGKTKKRISR